MCREEGKAIADLVARDDMPLDGFGIFGIVKEVGIDDEGKPILYLNHTLDLSFNALQPFFPIYQVWLISIQNSFLFNYTKMKSETYDSVILYSKMII